MSSPHMQHGESRAMLKPIQPPAQANQMQPAPLMPHRLSQMEADIMHNSKAQLLTSPTLGTMVGAQAASKASEEENEAAQQEAMMALMIAALKSPEGNRASGDEALSPMHARTPFSETNGSAPLQVPASSPPAATATGNGAGGDAHSDDDDDDDTGVEHEQKLFGKKSPSADGGGKGASSSSPDPNAAETARKTAAVEHARVVQQVLAALNNTDHRAYAFGPDDEATLTEAIKAKASEAEKAQLQPADKDRILQRAATTASLPISESEIVAYLTHSPLLYADSEAIAPPSTKAPLTSETPQAGRVYQQAIQALFLHNTLADFKRVETPADKEAKRKREAKREAKAAAAAKKKKQQQQQHSANPSASPSPCASDSESSDDDDDLPPPALSSLTFDAALAAAMDKSAAPPLSPLDSKHPTLRPLLLALEAAFDVPDRVTQKASAPFRHTVRHNLLLAQSLARLHQARLDSHPFYRAPVSAEADACPPSSSSSAFAADGPGSTFPTPALYGVWYQHENAHLNHQLNDLSDMQSFEKKHPRAEEEAARKKRAAELKEREREQQKKPSLIVAGTSGGSADSSDGAQPKPKKKKGFFSCCASAQEEPEVQEEARMQAKPAAAAAVPAVAASSLPSSDADDDLADQPDESIVSSWACENFHANYALLLQVLLQYETNIEAELDREEAAQRIKEKRKKKASEINVDELVHPDEMEARAEESRASSRGSQADEEEPLASIHTARTLNGCRIRALSAQSLKLLRIYASTFRVGLPFASTSNLALLASNLNFNAPEYYSAVTNELTIAQALYHSHVALTTGSAGGAASKSNAAAALILPFTTYELESLRRSVQSLWEWVALSLSRYQLVFAKTVEAVERKGGAAAAAAAQSKVAKHDAGAAEHGDEIPADDADADDIEADEWHDGLRECLYLFLKLRDLMEELGLPLHISSRDMSRAIAAAAASPPPSPPMRVETGEEPEASDTQPTNVAPQPVELLRSLIEPALTRRYQQLLERCASTDLSAASNAASAMAVESTPSPSLDSIRHVSHLTALLSAVSAELLLDQERSDVFQEVVKESDIEVRRREGENPAAAASTPAAAVATTPAAATSPAASSSSTATPPPTSPVHRPSVADLADPHSHRDGFHLAKIASATYLSFVWSDVQQFLVELRLQHGDLIKLPKLNKAQVAALQAIDAQIDGIVRSYAKFKDLYALVARGGVQNLPDLRSRVQSWYDWSIAAWITQTQTMWVQGSSSKVSQLIASDTFAIDLGSTRVRYSASFVALFAFLQPLAHAFKAMPFSQRNAEDFAGLLSAVITQYVSFVHDDVARVLDAERKKKILWGTTMTASKEVVLSLPPSLFVRANNILLCKSQLQLLLDELALPAEWRELLGDAMPVSSRARGATAAPDGLRSPAEQHSAQSPVLGAAELPNAEEKQASPSRLARHPVTSPLSPGPAAAVSALPIEASPLPPSVLNTLECRRAIDLISQCADDLVLRMTAGLGSFIEMHTHTVIWRDLDKDWSGRHTKEEAEPLLSYLSRHFDHLRAYLYDWLFVRLCFFLLSDFILILEKEMVHPQKQHWAHRLRTEQVHRVIQLHYIVLEFFEVEYRLPTEYVQRIKESHLKRLEYLETLLTGGSDELVAAFNAIPAAIDEAEHAKMTFTEREVLRLSRPPYLTRRHLAGILKFRAEEEGDHSVTGFLKEHKAGLFAANFFQ